MQGDMWIQAASSISYLLFIAGTAVIGCQAAHADAITFTGNLTSDATAVGADDPVITDPSSIHTGDPFSLVLTYNASSFTRSGSSYALTASLVLTLGSYEFAYLTASGNYIEFSAPGVFGAGTVSFLVCSSLATCGIDDFLNLYFLGTVTSPATLAAQAGTLLGDPSASPSEFEFLRNFPDGSQTDLEGTLGTSTPAPEPVSWPMLAMMVAGLVAALARRPTYSTLLKLRRD